MGIYIKCIFIILCIVQKTSAWNLSYAMVTCPHVDSCPRRIICMGWLILLSTAVCFMNSRILPMKGLIYVSFFITLLCPDTHITPKHIDIRVFFWLINVITHVFPHIKNQNTCLPLFWTRQTHVLYSKTDRHTLLTYPLARLSVTIT